MLYDFVSGLGTTNRCLLLDGLSNEFLPIFDD